MVLTCSPRPMRLRGCRLFRRGARAFPFRLRSRSPSPRPAQAPKSLSSLDVSGGFAGSRAAGSFRACATVVRLSVSPSAQCAPAVQPSVRAVPIDRRFRAWSTAARSSRSLLDTVLCCVRAVLAVGLAVVLVGVPRPTYVFRPRVRGTQLYVDCEMRRLSGLSPRGRGGDDLGPLGASAQTGSSPRAGRRSHHQSHRLRNSRIIPARGDRLRA